MKARIRIYVSAFLWLIWNCRNDIAFNNVEILTFCRLQIGIYIGSMNGLFSSHPTNRVIWILDVPDYRRSYGLSSADVDGGVLKVSMLSFVIFGWMIFIHPLCHPLVVTAEY